MFCGKPISNKTELVSKVGRRIQMSSESKDLESSK